MANGDPALTLRVFLASPNWIEVSVSLRQWMPAWMPWPKLMLLASLCSSPLTVSGGSPAGAM